MKSVYSAVRTGSLNITRVIYFLQSVNSDSNRRVFIRLSCRAVKSTNNSYSGPTQVPGHL